MTSKILLTCSIFLLISFLAKSQNSKLSGIIIDASNNKPLEAATVSLLKAKDSSILKLTLTDIIGSYAFENLKAGDYFIMATSTGHSKVYTAKQSLRANQPTTINAILLYPTVKSLKTVEVVSKKPFIERKIDKIILNVDALISNAGSTALEVLEKAPGVTVDKDGKVSLKGKPDVIIMLDGKPSYLSGDQLANLLKNMPASTIDQIELMTNPSAKYDASGNSGIINIRTKKIKLHGFNGNLTSGYTQGYFPRFNDGLNLNYRNGKINAFANLNYSAWNGNNNLQINRNFRNTVTKQLETVFDQYSEMQNHSHYYSIKTGLDYYMNPNTTLGVVLSGFSNPRTNTGDNHTYLKNPQGGIDSILYAINLADQKSTNFSANLNFRHAFDTTGTELTSDLDYIVYDESGTQNYLNSYLNADLSKRKDNTELRGSLPAKVQIYSAKADYTKTLKKETKLELGVKSSYVKTDNDALYENNTTTGWLTDYGKTNHFIYNENINAGYVNLNRQIKKWGIQAGLRVENTIATGHQLGNISRPDSSFKRNYTNAFPTLYVSYEANKKNSFSLNYGRRIDRPAYQDLNPFYYFLDEYTYQVGNTLLKPQFTNSVELSHTYKGFFTTTLNYSVTNDVIADIINQINSERKTFVTKDNIATKRNMGIAVSANFAVTKFWNANLYGNLLNDKYNGAVSGGVLDVNSTMFMSNVNNQFKFKKGWSAELSGFYRSKGIEGQIVMDPMWSLSTGVQKQILKTKGSLKLAISDFLNTQKFVGIVKYQDIDVAIHERNDSRRVSLTFSYRFGKPMKNQQPRRRTGGASDEQQRVKTGN